MDRNPLVSVFLVGLGMEEGIGEGGGGGGDLCMNLTKHTYMFGQIVVRLLSGPLG